MGEKLYKRTENSNGENKTKLLGHGQNAVGYKAKCYISILPERILPFLKSVDISVANGCFQ